MKYSIIISPITENSNASQFALRFIQSLLKEKTSEISVFFYGYAVRTAFKFDSNWQKISKNNITLQACSTIADTYLKNNISAVNYIKFAGLGQWMESVHNADKNIEFV
jgi:sulfur relay (sulfurtransferase) complex TusBCD TusD component (DsrE family)